MVGSVLTVLGNVVLIGLGGLEAGGASNQLVSERRLMLLGVGVVPLVVVVRLLGIV